MTDPPLAVPTAEHVGTRAVLRDLPRELNPDLARLLGYIVAEGCSTQVGSFDVTQDATLNPEVHEDIGILLRSQLGWAGDPMTSPGRPDSFRVNSTQVRKYLEWMGVDYTRSAGKRIPHVVLRATRASAREFLRGFVDAEGSVDERGVVEVSTASERLGRELQTLLLQFGVVSSRRPKHVKGRSHVYWRITMTGADARVYADEVGFVSQRKTEAFRLSRGRSENPNTDVVPHASRAVQALYEEMLVVAGGQNNGGGLTKRFGWSFMNTVKHVRSGRRHPSFAFLQRMLAVADEVGVGGTTAAELVRIIVQHGWFYDVVVDLEEGFTEVMDVEVDDPSHMFVGNGLLNHNTSSAIASMMKAERDGLLDPGQKFLYVCPPALRGNLPLEVERFVENSDAFLDRVDIMTFPQFRVAANKDPSFASRYAMVFFDEAQHLKNITSATAQAALQLRHPKKVLLTASPMEKSPMEAFTLVAICNNLDLTTPDGRAQIRGFRRRFCEEVGGKIVGIKNDPVILHDFRVWLKQNLFFADKRDVEEVALPHLRIVPLVVEMDSDVEAAYRDASKGVEKVLRGMVAKYRDRDPRADDPAIEAARVALAAEFRKLHELGSMPNRVIPGARNPKLDQTVEIVEERVGSGRRTLVFTDSPDLASDAAQALSAKFPVHLVAECQSAEIRVWQAGESVRTYGPKVYTSNKKQWAKGEWKSFVLSQVVSPRPEFLVAVLTSSYAHGQNLQAFDTVVHLDRDSWNNETMKQRTARAWRSGQDHGVDEYILDAVYADPQHDGDETLDQIIGHLQRLESDLFDQVIVESQAEALGKEWFGMRRMHSSLVELNRRVLELTSSPFARRVGIGVQDPTPTGTQV